MHLKFRNVNDAFRGLVGGIHNGSIPTEERTSRNGSVLMVPEPVTISYERPNERVLFNPARDCNPTFHLYESLWMLAGRNDVAPVAYYAKQMREYSDDGHTLNGAYGYRWRKAISLDSGSDYSRDVDQLDVLVNHLKADPTSRRAVLQMWNVEDDLLKVGGPKENAAKTIGWNSVGSKDVCCNLSVMFSLREIKEKDPTVTEGGLVIYHGKRTHSALDMTVTNRSNDMVWGMLGANYVHFTFLQEYMAARLGVEVGRYNHFTNNLHVYTWNWKPEEWLAAERAEYHEPASGYTTVPLVNDPAAFDREVVEIVEANKDGGGKLQPQRYSEPFLETVAKPMFRAWHAHKDGDTRLAVPMLDAVAADDWRTAAQTWMQRRIKSTT